jgi:UDPglucose 6-dehydrogenase
MKYEKLKLGIIGHGFVGKATDYGFNKDVEKFIVDPVYSTTVDDLAKFSPDIIFICVPTPMSADGSQDCSIVLESVKKIKEYGMQSIIVLKSTILPSYLEEIEKFDENIIYNPEFLREKHAKQDFINSRLIVFGGKKSVSEKVSKFYQRHSRCIHKNHIFVELKTASFIKYIINTFLASKVLLFNEYFQLFNSLNSNDSWEDIIKIIAIDERIGSSHMGVPGHDGRFGFGGACFPKDTAALAAYSDGSEVDMKVLKEIIKKNNKIRSQYKSLDKREQEQNVSFSLNKD